MALSVDGLVSGLDTTSIISQLIALERRPITLLEGKQVTLTDQKQAWQEINTRLLAFETAAQKINTASEFKSIAALFRNNSSTGGSVLSVNAGPNASDGSFNIVVSQLAAVEKWVTSDNISDPAANLSTSGTITITANATNYDITVSNGDSLNTVKMAINASAAPVTATVFNAGTSGSPDYRLVITGDSSGSANAISVSDTTSLTFSNTQNAQDATFTLDGVSVTKDSNTVTDVINDVTMSLETVGSGSITFSTDHSAIIGKIQGFADAYNELMDFIKEQFTFNQSLNEKGALFGNSSLLTIQTQLRSIVSGAVPGIDATDPNNLAYLSQVGIKTDELNHLVINENTLTEMMKDRFDDVRNLFVSSGSGTYNVVAASGKTTGGVYDTSVSGGVLQLRLQGGDGTWITMDTNSGFATGPTGSIVEGLLLETGALTDGTGSVTVVTGVAERVATNTSTYTEFSATGLIFNQNKSIEDQDKDLQEQIDDLEARIAKKEEDLKAKFVSLETLLSRLTSQQGFLDQQLSNLSRGWKSV